MDLPLAQEQLLLYKQTKIKSCKTMMVSPRGFMEDSYDFVWCLVSFLSSYKLIRHKK